jgi:predicted kinase
MKTNKLYILCGIPFSGKTTLSKELEKTLGFKRVDLDEVKFELFGSDVKDSGINQEGWDKIYQEMYKLIEESLVKGQTVLHDTGNFTKHERDLVKNIASKLGIEAITIFVNTPVAVARERLLQNRRINHRFDVTDEDFESTVNEMEQPAESEKHIVYEFETPVDRWIDNNFKH